MAIDWQAGPIFVASVPLPILLPLLLSLTNGGLKNYYGKSDGLTFEDDESVKIYELFIQGKTDEEILSIINNKKNMEETTNEVY